MPRSPPRVLDELQRAVHAAGLVAVHAAGHQHDREIVAPDRGYDREQGIVIRWIVELAVLHARRSARQAIDARHHLVGVSCAFALARQPLRALGAPQATPGVPIG